MNFSDIYYLQVNLMCIIFIGYLAYATPRDGANSEMKHFRWIVGSTILLCVTDMIGSLLAGKMFEGARAILYVADVLYSLLPFVMAVLWERYVQIRLADYGYSRTETGWIFTEFMLLFCMAILTTPATDFYFYLDEMNMYHRKPIAYVASFFCWGYFVYTSIRVRMMQSRIGTLSGKHVAEAVSHFGIPPLLAIVLQLIFQGISVLQVGISVSILSIYLFNQQSRIMQDRLTGLNNRRSYEKYVEDLEASAKTVAFCFIDADGFKGINDTYGHEEGDAALKEIADILRRVSKEYNHRLFLARFGGDEFVVAMSNCWETVANKLVQNITDEVERSNARSDKPYKLSLSVGYCYVVLDGSKTVADVVRMADEKMYDIKRKRHASKGK